MSYHDKSRQSNRRYNRWDRPNGGEYTSSRDGHNHHRHRQPSQQQTQGPRKVMHHESNSNVSDEQALEALLCSANEHQKKKQEIHHPNRGKKRTTSGSSQYQQHMKVKQNNQISRNDYYQPQQNIKEREPLKRHKSDSRREEEKMDSNYSFGKQETDDAEIDAPPLPPGEKIKANFGLSGALANDDQTGNAQNGITLKFSEPPEARIPNTRWRLYVFKNSRESVSNQEESVLLDTLHISKQSSYLFGRERQIADIPVDHSSLSKQHCVLQYRALVDQADGKLRCKPYLMDLGSTNGTFINGIRLEDARYYELRKGDVITLGASSREYVLLTENSTSADLR